MLSVSINLIWRATKVTHPIDVDKHFESKQNGLKTLGVTAASEKRVVDPNTGGAKGQKIERYDLIPAEPLRQLALVYGAGAKKYDDDNWRKGYSWRLSLGAMSRHLWAWVRGEKYDAECSELAGQPVSHLAQVAWHAFTLLEFETFELGTDDIAEHVRASGNEVK